MMNGRRLSRQLTVKSPPVVLGKDTLKFWVSDGVISHSVVGFGKGEFRQEIEPGKKIDIVYQISVDDWNQEPGVQLQLKDFCESN